ncbi:MAG: EAL domain-containing protein, partial [Pseudomonadota bacterium]
RVFLPALLLVIILVTILSFTLIGNSLIPLQRLTSAVQQITSGNLDTRLRIRSNDEFEALGRAFNKMAERLGRQFSTFEAMSEIDRQILSGAKFEEVSENVINHLLETTGCAAAAVIARDSDTPQWAKMISRHDGEFTHERISLPMEMGHQWCQPRQVTLEDTDAMNAPYRDRFLDYGLKYAALIPVVLKDDLKGILLLSSTKRFNLEQDSLVRCIDLAGRFAVALSSAEREEALYRQAHFDQLTGLPNRQLLKDRLEQQIVQARRDQYSGALLFLDLDRFKEINDVYGHSVGDVVLVQAAERIIGEVRDSDTVARLGGDEFVVVLPRIDSGSRVRATATRLLDRLTESFSVRGTDHFVGASIGIVMFPDDGDSVETLLKNADAAMYRAKDSGRARFEFFSKKLNAESRRKISLERDLRTAFHNHELEVHYQPQFNIASGVISGAEALLRWQHAREGFVPPSEFIPLAEDSGLITDIGRWVIRRTCRDLRRVLNKGFHPGAVSVNVSALQLRDPNFVSDVLGALQRYDIHPGYLMLEVTETAVAQNRDTVIGILETLREHGVRVAIDDFGTGYSSLSYLQQMPFDVIKIDKSFVDRIDAGDSTENICRTIIKMAHELGKESIAEGVEEAAQVDFLKANACDHVQGFYYSQALDPEAFLEFIEKQDFHTQRRKALEIVKI